MECNKYILHFLILFCFGIQSQCKNINDSRMIGGKPTNITDFPYVASILHFGEHVCGGVIVGRYFVLTAAQCFKNVKDESEIQVRVGSFRAYYSGVILDTDFYLLHPDFDNKTFEVLEHDVALIKVSYPIGFDENTQPAMVADLEDEPVAGTKSVVPGWERFEARDYAGDLRKIDVEIMHQFDCFLSYMDKNNSTEITENHLCASSAYFVDACRGDVGAPLVEDGLIVGLFSWVGKCGDPQQPGVYSNLSKYHMWIDHILKLLS